MKTDVNVPLLNNEQKDFEKQLIFCWDLVSDWKNQGPDL
jgi:hypothetical protein